MRFFYAYFEGHYPVGAVIVAVAPNEKIASYRINDTLRSKGFKKVELNEIREISNNICNAQILLDGEY